MSRFRNFLDKFRGKGSPPRAPRVLPRDEPVGTEVVRTGPLEAGDIDRGLHWGEKIHVTSSNVSAVQYQESTKQLTVWFLAKGKRGESCYVYDGISRGMMYDFLTAPSKGRWVWTNLRETGRPFVRVF